MTRPRIRAVLASALALVLVAGFFTALRANSRIDRTHVVGYFANSTGIFVGDDVRILGVPVGKIDRIEPQGTRVKITFWYDAAYNVPAEAKAVILSPSLVPVRAIQLTPAYTGGPAMVDNAVIPQERTGVPLEWDELRQQLQKLTTTLEPTQPGGVSALGSFINTAADNLRGQGANIRKALIELSQAFSALGDHSDDIFSTVKNLSTLVSALRDSTDVIRQLNANLAAATALLSNGPNEIGNAVRDVNDVAADVQSFVAANRETLGTTSNKVASVSTALIQSLDDLKQTLHIAPNTVQNFINVYHPAQAAIAGAAVVNTFANPITFLCGAIQAASRLNAEQSAKLCVQYLAPIVKNRQYNFLPLGFNPIVGATARPNELTYSEDWLRPDHRPSQPPPTAPPADSLRPPAEAPPPADLPVASPPNPELRQTNPAQGLQGLMMPPGAES
ncbi:mammalian cell entry protein [Mycobacterium triplex]|uniref:Mammalian cell entry protein n=1 Tax=Mycobacterium triplex TaxID=47839 RepID=A0A024JRB6_9MYCO|nr:MCE family protein [Mycobacterium triplex]ORW99090.1 mammalian cell entry protein [Mycobacterium triplex]CDO86151.1 virulence factor Mce family protein [Mycobacterium triplex]